MDFKHYPADRYVEYDGTTVYELERDYFEQHEVDFWDDLGQRMLDMRVRKWPYLVYENISYHTNESNICNLRKIINR